ncbi:hypothetical protein IMCC3135_09745 [Granulosicoccus antarcticus IMCC3135]|uniref:Uncharacterized protein n=1 Tax=Granulosicoccus antarcticus IMCC3135 TaxID=1192854 RepID=A0A2Z2NND8_9GAMM|nr:hypothetical protein IMCC3135_09745 [Granulosicoccus antarcticus IMCC3135]
MLVVGGRFELAYGLFYKALTAHASHHCVLGNGKFGLIEVDSRASRVVAFMTIFEGDGNGFINRSLTLRAIRGYGLRNPLVVVITGSTRTAIYTASRPARFTRSD